MWDVSEDAPDASGGGESDRLKIDQFSAVPIHLRECEQFREQAHLACLRMIELHVERAWRVYQMSNA